MKFSAFVKTEAADKCGVWARVDDATSDVLQFDNMMERAIIGTNDWNYYSVVLDVNEMAESLHFGVLLIGKGKVWIDQFKIEEVNLSVPSTDIINKQQNLPAKPINLKSEDDSSAQKYFVKDCKILYRSPILSPNSQIYLLDRTFFL
ncbi:hypothetical protein [Staphylococcus coagulans]|uniref:hypothetical protein n=1 Tax=Staphylococcus coagulans TaxID=74706 RepID=UPI003364E7CB